MPVTPRRDRERLDHVGGRPPAVPREMAVIPTLVEGLRRAPTHDEIACRACQRFEERGGEPGRDREDWFLAEREL